MQQPNREIWKDIPGFENYYQASNLGRIRSLDREIDHPFGRYIKKGIVRKPRYNSAGYEICNLYVVGLRYDFKVHHLIMMTFVGPRPKGMDVLHGPNGKKDNSINNLRYGTHEENMLDKIRDQTDHNSNKTHCKRNHLLEEPNLIVAALPQKRQCLTCDLVLNSVRYHNRTGKVLSDTTIMIMFEEKYKKIMSAA